MIWIELFLTFLKIGAFTFGGGYAMLPLIQSEVERHGWLTQAEVVDFIAVSESTPGPLAINMATFVGIRTGGVLGAVCATLGVVLPSFVIILIVAKFYEKFRKSRAVCLYGNPCRRSRSDTQSRVYYVHGNEKARCLLCDHDNSIGADGFSEN